MKMESNKLLKKNLQEIQKLLAEEINELRLINEQIEAGKINDKQFKIKMKAYDKSLYEVKKTIKEIKRNI